MGLRVQMLDELGQAASSPPPPFISVDLSSSVRPAVVRLARPVDRPRLRFGDTGPVVAFRLQRFQFKEAPPFPPLFRVEVMGVGVLHAFLEGDRHRTGQLLLRTSPFARSHHLQCRVRG